jgi:predicted SnoaL-like aldol condensation-catalyzing enzyme
MRRSILVIGLVLLTFTPVKAEIFDVYTEKEDEYKVWCRHNAIYWASVIGEAHQVRIAIGFYETQKVKGLHAQPQIKISNNWYYFRAEEYNSPNNDTPRLRYIIIDMPKKPEDKWKLYRTMSFGQFVLMHNTWIKQSNGKTWAEYDIKRWSKEMNRIINELRLLEKEVKNGATSR